MLGLLIARPKHFYWGNRVESQSLGDVTRGGDAIVCVSPWSAVRPWGR